MWLPGRSASGTQRQDLYAVPQGLRNYVQDKTVSQIQAKDRILEYLKHKPSITNQKAQELCGFNKNQTYYILHQMCKDGILQPDGVGRGTKYKSVK